MSEIIETQVSGTGGPIPEGISTGTNLLLPARVSSARLSHFPEETYDLRAESHLVRFIKVLLGDAGAGQLRKRLVQARLQQSLQGIHFHNLDRFYGALFGIRRSPAEVLDLDPYTQTATNDVWVIQHAKDASYRSRIAQFARSLSFGPTPTGIELVAEALLGVDADVYETYTQADSGYQTHGELEDQYGSGGFYGDYFDGDTDGGSWSGTPDASTSTVGSWTNLVLNPKPVSAAQWSSTGMELFAATEDGAPALRAARNVSHDSDAIVYPTWSGAFPVGGDQWVRYALEVKAIVPLTVRVEAQEFAGASVDSSIPVVERDLDPSEGWVRIEMQGITDASTTTLMPALYLYALGTTNFPEAGDLLFLRRASLEVDPDEGSTLDMEGVLYSALEGQGLPRLAGDERREFVVRPKRPITEGEAYNLLQVLRRIKPADARPVIYAEGSIPYGTVPVRGLVSDSDYWEVVPRVVTRDLPDSPYQAPSPSSAVEQPRPPFAAYQGEAWSHIGDIIGVAAFEASNPARSATITAMVTQRVMLPDGSYLEYPAQRALMPRRHLLAGRSASDGALVAHPYWASSPRTTPDLAPLFVDRIPLESLNTLLAQHPIERFPQNPIERFWASPERPAEDRIYEILEISLGQPRRLNYLSVEIVRFPHRIIAQIRSGGQWITIGQHEITDSVPAYLPPGAQVLGHPQHAHPGHWERISMNLDTPHRTSSVRFLLQRIEGTPPTANGTDPVPYSLALRSLDIGYRVRSLEDVHPEAMTGEEPIGATLDQVGSRVEFHLNRLSADRLLESPEAIWKSEPQPVNYAVVNLYVDVRTESGDAQVLDTIYLDPLYPGASVSVYWTEEVGEPQGRDWYEQRVWRPVDGDYRLQKGYLRLPPIAARHIKLEFTALAAEPHSSLLPLTRTIRFFPQWLIDAYANRGMLGDEGMPSGLRTAIEIGDELRYADALFALSRTVDIDVDLTQYMATEAIYAPDLDASKRLSEESWAFGFTPWHQGTEAPRFPTVGQHHYQTIEMQHTTQIGFFVGLRDLRILRTDPTQDDDSLLYDEFFHDFRQIEPGFTWTFEPGRLETVLENDCVATSRVYQSRANVWGLQFATQQTDPVQVVPDDDLRDPALATIDWSDNDEGWHRVGDATVVYSPQNHSARIVRYAQPPLRPTNVLPGLLQPPHHEVFSYRNWVTDDSTQTAESFGGIESPLLGVSASGMVYGAVRMTFITAPTSPMLFQVLDGDTEEPLLTHEISGVAGETVERYYPFPLSGSSAVRVRLIQQGISNDLWEVDRLSLFDPGIRWEFSVDGGETWVDAGGVRNNAHGIITFPEPGNQLVWRASGMRPRMAISSLRIRPLYRGVHNARYNGVHRGPNVSSYDVGLPVTEDPLFNTWAGPIPRDWFLAYRQFPTLVSADGPTVTEFARFYGRPVEETLPAPTDEASRQVAFRRAAGDLAWVDDQTPTYDQAVRQVSFYRSGSSALPTPGESAWALVIQKSTWGPHNVPVHRP